SRPSSPGKSRTSGGSGRGRDTSLDNKRALGKNSPLVGRDVDRRDAIRNDRDPSWKANDSRKEQERVREKDDDRKKGERDLRRSETTDRRSRDRDRDRDQPAREAIVERGGNSRATKEESRRDDTGRKRESQMLPGIVEKTPQDRDFLP
ncbi:unnamed protein product, partial [Timema podura]|nr:unnamed protein product [Timema podura]